MTQFSVCMVIQRHEDQLQRDMKPFFPHQAVGNNMNPHTPLFHTSTKDKSNYI